MYRHLPSLSALRVFEAAGRHESFTVAADELCVTTSAVSRQIRALEDEVGLRLFERRPRGLRPDRIRGDPPLRSIGDLAHPQSPRDACTRTSSSAGALPGATPPRSSPSRR
jgi:hypothetical protein